VKRSRCCVVSLQRLLLHLARFRLWAHRWMNGMWHVDLSSRRRSAACPNCQHRSRAVHSTYQRTVADLPLVGATLFLHLQVRRFFCRHTTCPRRIFAERFPTLVPVRGRHSRGVCSALRHVGIAVGSRAGVRLARALGIPGSFRTIVRLVHGAPFPPLKAPRVIGLDEWAWRRGRRFGTMICDLERDQVVDLLPERTAPSVAQWLKVHPSVEIVWLILGSDIQPAGSNYTSYAKQALDLQDQNKREEFRIERNNDAARQSR
jgi:transposase